MKILVTGKGGREHALITALSESPGKPRAVRLAGQRRHRRPGHPCEAADLPGLIDWMQREKIDLCVAGEEAWLVRDEGLANLCEKAGIPCWGPFKQAAQLEASKIFAKRFLQRHGIPTADFQVATTADEARAALTAFPSC
jgi:phosphoribosylamine---glycine ligase